MKKVLLLTMAVSLVASISFAQTGGHIGIYSDAGSYAECNLDAAPFALFSVYVVHQLTDALGAQFKIVDNGTGWQKSGYASNHALNIGADPFVETAVSYDGPCPHVTPILIGTITYFHAGTQVACGSLQIVDAPTANNNTGGIIANLCTSQDVPATGGTLTAGGDLTCPCAVAIEETTWGQMKALYN